MKTAIGLMSGTSMDGIDVALVQTDGLAQLEFGPTMAIDYPAAFRRSIEVGLAEAAEISDRDERPGGLAQLERELTDQHAAAVAEFLKSNNLKVSEIDLLGFHGQTVLHRPDDGLTVQLGDGQALARASGIDVVYDMRAEVLTAFPVNGGRIARMGKSILHRRQNLRAHGCAGVVIEVSATGRHCFRAPIVGFRRNGHPIFLEI